ncbi:hypothetical protein ABPG72_021215, partial [Tetrahymena utriculariae]
MSSEIVRFDNLEAFVKSNNCDIKNLYLDLEKDIDANLLSKIIQAIKNIQNLQNLRMNLSQNQFGDDGVCQIGECLTNCKNITNLELWL